MEESRVVDVKVPLSCEDRACLRSCPLPVEGTFQMQNTARRAKIAVSDDGQGTVSHAGALLLTETARITGLQAGLSAGLGHWRPPRAVHDPGKIVTDLAVAVTLGGDCPADAGVLRAELALFGPVASDPVISRLVMRLAADAPGRAEGHPGGAGRST